MEHSTLQTARRVAENVIVEEFAAHYNATEPPPPGGGLMDDGIPGRATESARRIAGQLGPEGVREAQKVLERAAHDPHDPLVAVIGHRTHVNWQGGQGEWLVLHQLLRQIGTALDGA